MISWFVLFVCVVCLFVCLVVCLFLCLLVCLIVCLVVWLFVCLFVLGCTHMYSCVYVSLVRLASICSSCFDPIRFDVMRCYLIQLVYNIAPSILILTQTDRIGSCCFHLRVYTCPCLVRRGTCTHKKRIQNIKQAEQARRKGYGPHKAKQQCFCLKGI